MRLRADTGTGQEKETPKKGVSMPAMVTICHVCCKKITGRKSKKYCSVKHKTQANREVSLLDMMQHPELPGYHCRAYQVKKRTGGQAKLVTTVDVFYEHERVVSTEPGNPGDVLSGTELSDAINRAVSAARHLIDNCRVTNE